MPIISSVLSAHAAVGWRGAERIISYFCKLSGRRFDVLSIGILIERARARAFNFSISRDAVRLFSRRDSRK